MDALEQGFRLEELRVEPHAGEVSGPGGREKLDLKVMAVLVQMARHAGEVVSREELDAALWPGVVVTDDALTRCLYELRGHLSRAGGDKRYRALVETLPKRGYRLNGTVVPMEAAATPHPPKRRVRRMAAWAIAAAVAIVIAVVATVLAGRLPPAPAEGPGHESASSIAVLPFLDMSAAKDQGFFSEGVTEEILNRLSQAGNLRVISRTSSFSLRDKSLDVPEIGERLNVDYVLEGSVRKSSDRIRITAQLIDVFTNSHVWSETYDRGLDDLFAVQDEIAASVAAALQVTLAGGKSRDHMPENIQAYEQFLQGKFFYNRRSPGDIDRSIRYYKEAVTLDPRYASAWAALAGAYSLLASNGGHPEVEMRKMQGEAARKAVEIDPKLAVARARLSQYYFEIGERARANEEYRAAAALDPDDPLVMGFASSDALRRGDLDQAVALWRRIVARDPLSPTNRLNLANILLVDGRLDESLAENKKLLELQPDSGPKVDFNIMRILILQGRYEEAKASVERLPSGELQDYGLALMHLAPGRQAESRAALKRLKGDPRDAEDKVRLAEVYAFRGMHDEAFALLQETHDALELQRSERPYLSSYFREELRYSPFLKPLWADPRWPALIALPG